MYAGKLTVTADRVSEARKSAIRKETKVKGDKIDERNREENGENRGEIESEENM